MASPTVYRFEPHFDRHTTESTAVTDRLFQKPTLLCCGGIKTCAGNKDAYDFAHKFAHVGAGLLGVNGTLSAQSPLDIVAVAYPEYEPMLVKKMHNHTQRFLDGDPFDVSGSASAFARRHLFPLIEDESGALLPSEAISRNLSNVRILAHSYGGIFAQCALAALAEHLLSKGISKAEAKTLMQHIVMVTAGSPMCVGSSEIPVTALHMLNHNDSEARNAVHFQDAAKHLFQELDGLLNHKAYPVGFGIPKEYEKTYVDRPLSILPVKAKARGGSLRFDHDANGSEYMMYLAPPVMTNAFGDVITKPAINPYLERSNCRGEFDGKRAPADTTGHQARTYFYFGRKADESGAEENNALMPRMAAASVLINAMNHTLTKQTPEAPALRDLLKLPQTIAYAQEAKVPYANIAKAAHYRVRIDTALSLDRKTHNVPVIN